MNWRVTAIVAVLVAPVIWVLAMGFGRDPHAVPSVLENRPAPAFDLKTLDGRTVSLASLRGKPVLINFWSSWCEPCKAEHATLQSSAQGYGDKVQFVGIVYQDTPEGAVEYLRARGNTFPQLLDPDTRVAIDYGVAGVPESFFIDKNGVIRKKYVGPLSYGEIRGTFDKLLAEAGAPRPGSAPPAAEVLGQAGQRAAGEAAGDATGDATRPTAGRAVGQSVGQSAAQSQNAGQAN